MTYVKKSSGKVPAYHKTFGTYFLVGLGASSMIWGTKFSPASYRTNDVHAAWSEVGDLLQNSVRDFGKRHAT